MAVEINQIISHYKILQELGRGGMGEVYLAEDTTLSRKVALKFLSQSYAEIPEFKTRFKREAETAASIRHPNIIVIHEIGEFKNRPYFVMEYIDGETLGNLIARKELQMPEVIDILIQFGDGLRKAHQQGVIHRDIKPSNILIDRDGFVKIVDFGLAKLQDASNITAEGTRMGTIPYMSPEQDLGQELDQCSDIFSLGVVLYEMITRQLPFRGDTSQAVSYARLYTEPEPLARYKRGISDDMQRIVDKALDKDRDTRYQNVDSILADLKKARKLSASVTMQPTILIPQKSYPPKPATHPRRKLWPALSAIFILLLVGLGAYLYFQFLQEQLDNKPGPPKDVSIAISSKPAGATVFMNNISLGVTPLRARAKPGAAVLLRLQKAGYVTLDTTVSFAAGKEMNLAVALKPIPPAVISQTPAVETKATETQRTPKEPAVKTPQTGALQIVSEPAGAEILLNGQSFGTTPRTLRDLQERDYSLVLRKTGYQEYSLAASVEASKTKRVTASLIVLTGRLIVSLKPSGAIYVDGALKKDNVAAPYEISLPIGAHRVKMESPGLGVLEKSVMIEAGGQKALTVDFTKQAALIVTAFDENNIAVRGEIFIDGQPSEYETPRKLKLRVGRHLISVRREGFSGAEQAIDVEENIEKSLKLVLKRNN